MSLKVTVFPAGIMLTGVLTSVMPSPLTVKTTSRSSSEELMSSDAGSVFWLCTSA